MSSNGSYIKTACFIGAVATHTNAGLNCLSLGMALYVIDNQVVQSAIFQMALQLYGTAPVNVLYVDGEKQGSSWVGSSYGSYPLWTGLTWATSAQAATGCLVVTNVYGPYNIDGAVCSVGWYYVCEYKK